jgi:TonB-dependent starch-binding outer membrane protein SusC
MRKTTTQKAATLLMGLLLMVCAAFAQNKTVTGKVTDSKDGSPVVGASVTAKGSNKGTRTGADGAFTLSVPESTRQLTISSVNFTALDVDVTGGSIDAKLTAISGDLTGVVVVGYGTRKVKDATGSVATITPKDFNKGQISSPEQLFQGRTPGVTVSPSSGEPGAAATINIRGTAAIRGNQEPLYVIDGVPMDGGGTTGGFGVIEGGSSAKNPLSFINPNDIESISILKDASSAAIYGARAANGVIIVTTKNGRGKQGSFQFGMTTSFNSPAARYDLLGAKDFVRGVYTQNVLAGTSPADAAAAVVSQDKGFDTDWQDQIFRNSLSQNYNLSWGFARKQTSLRVSGSYDNQQGIIKKSALKRATLRANFTQTFLANDALKLEAQASYSNLRNVYVPNTNNAGYQGSLVGAAIRLNPTFPVKDPTTGKFYQDPGGSGSRNPAELLEYIDDKDNINRILTNLSLSYKITDGLTIKTTLGYDNADGARTSYADPRLNTTGQGNFSIFGSELSGSAIANNGRAIKQNSKTSTLLTETTLNYVKTFNGKHNLNAIVGTSYQKSKGDYTGFIHYGITTPVVNANDVFNKSLSTFSKNAEFVPGFSQSELNSYFGRVEYNFNEKYYLTATVRVDGSSRFGKNNKYGTFPAFAAKWRVMNEDFAKNSLGKIFSDLSVRANYGIIGSQDGLDPYASVDISTTWFTNPIARTGSRTDFNRQGNPDLKWEEATTTGIGLDWESKGGRLRGTIDYFHTDRKNIIFFGPTPGGFSASTNYFSNLPGKVTNSGLEFSLGATLVKKQKFTWDVNYNMTFTKNLVTGIGVPVITGAVSGQGLTGAYAQVIKNGEPLFSWNMPRFNGFDNQGLAIYAGGDEIIGSALPNFNAGLTNSFTFGRWNASVFMNAVTGFYVYNNTANALFLNGALKNGSNIDYRTLNSLENPINPGSVSTRFLEKGDFLRISNATLGYNFNIKNKHIKTLSAVISGQNLALFTNYSGLDPEVNVDKNINGVPSRGFDYAGYPKARTISISINVGF